MRQSDLPEESRQRLRQARIDFAGYYGAATPADAEVMDQLVLAHAAYLATVQFRRDEVPDQVRQQLERLSFTVDQLFTYRRGQAADVDINVDWAIHSRLIATFEAEAAAVIPRNLVHL